MPITVDPARYRYVPGATELTEVDDVATLGLHDHADNPITEESLARDADEAERRQRAGLIPGGKSLSGGGKHSPAVRVVLPEAVLAQVRARAGEADMSVSRYLRRVIERDLEPAA